MDGAMRTGTRSGWRARATAVSALNKATENAQAIILAQGLIMNSTSLSLIYDHKGKAYFVPMSCINDPLEYFVEKKEDPNGPKEVVPVVVSSAAEIAGYRAQPQARRLQNKSDEQRKRADYQDAVPRQEQAERARQAVYERPGVEGRPLRLLLQPVPRQYCARFPPLRLIHK